MRINSRPRRARGMISYVAVLVLAVLLTGMMLGAYRKSLLSQGAQSETQLRLDYADREDAILRAIITIAPNRAMRAMRDGSDSSSTVRNPLRWQNIFEDSLDVANARTAADIDMLTTLGIEDVVSANVGDASFSAENRIFDAIEPESGYVAPGVDRSLGLGFPPPLTAADSATASNDRVYPLITTKKYYGTHASGLVGLPVDDYPQFNLIPYPEIHFGYAQPGQPFVAKRNWWAFSVDMSDHDEDLTGLPRIERDFIFSIYEIPSQLAISAAAFTNVGMHADGTPWQNANIQGGVFASKVEVQGEIEFDRISGRRGIALGEDAVIGGDNFGADPFAPGVREQFELQNQRFMPVFLSSESGRAAFIPINRGIEFFDRFRSQDEDTTVSSTTWNDYSVGAMQCAMQLDVVEVNDEDDQFPTVLRLKYFQNGIRQEMTIPVTLPSLGLPPGYVRICSENDTVFFEDPVDVAYGLNGHYAFESGVSGWVTFDNARFGDPLVGTNKGGFYKASYPWEVRLLYDSKPCIELYPERIPAFLDWINADGPEVNHSLVINVDYVTNDAVRQPAFPCEETDIGVIIKECADLTGFSRGFSLVTNLRLYIGDDFNTVDTTPPTGSGIPTPYYPPASLFSPEKRYGTDVDPYRLDIKGQMGSLASEDSVDPVRLLDLKLGSETEADPGRIEVNLAPIAHPGALPPVSMMNWLVVIEERPRELYDEGYSSAR